MKVTPRHQSPGTGLYSLACCHCCPAVSSTRLLLISQAITQITCKLDICRADVWMLFLTVGTNKHQLPWVILTLTLSSVERWLIYFLRNSQDVRILLCLPVMGLLFLPEPSGFTSLEYCLRSEQALTFTSSAARRKELKALNRFYKDNKAASLTVKLH